MEIDYISTGNEPVSSVVGPNNQLSGMFLSSRWILENLYPTLKKSPSLATKIVGFEEETDFLIPYVIYTKFFQKKPFKQGGYY